VLVFLKFLVFLQYIHIHIRLLPNPELLDRKQLVQRGHRRYECRDSESGRGITGIHSLCAGVVPYAEDIFARSNNPLIQSALGGIAERRYVFRLLNVAEDKHRRSLLFLSSGAV